ncbi:hypothetical protein C8J57DRAFT_1228603 [Mycena rebaudengoi]|nr:hypothetical protein C8J57DRAFT_1228603 [Mycena rebaudengoi]
MNSAPFTDGGVQEVIQISSLTEPSLEVIQVNPCGIGKQLRVLGPKFCGERLWNISLHQMEGQGCAASQNCSRSLLGRRVKSAASYTIARRCGGENMGRKKSAGYRINSNTIQCQATIAEWVCRCVGFPISSTIIRRSSADVGSVFEQQSIEFGQDDPEPTPQGPVVEANVYCLCRIVSIQTLMTSQFGNPVIRVWAYPKTLARAIELEPLITQTQRAPCAFLPSSYHPAPG